MKEHKQCNFLCNFTNLNISYFIKKIEINFDKGKCYLKFQVQPILGRKILKEIVDYSKNIHLNDIIEIKFINKNGTVNETLLISNFSISNIKTKLDVNNSSSTIIEFDCVGQHDMM